MKVKKHRWKRRCFFCQDHEVTTRWVGGQEGLLYTGEFRDDFDLGEGNLRSGAQLPLARNVESVKELVPFIKA